MMMGVYAWIGPGIEVWLEHPFGGMEVLQFMWVCFDGFYLNFGMVVVCMGWAASLQQNVQNCRKTLAASLSPFLLLSINSNSWLEFCNKISCLWLIAKVLVFGEFVGIMKWLESWCSFDKYGSCSESIQILLFCISIGWCVSPIVPLIACLLLAALSLLGLSLVSCYVWVK